MRRDPESGDTFDPAAGGVSVQEGGRYETQETSRTPPSETRMGTPAGQMQRQDARLKACATKAEQPPIGIARRRQTGDPSAELGTSLALPGKRGGAAAESCRAFAQIQAESRRRLTSLGQVEVDGDVEANRDGLAIEIRGLVLPSGDRLDRRLKQQCRAADGANLGDVSLLIYDGFE